MVLKDKQLTAIQHISTGKDVFVQLPDKESCFYMVLPLVLFSASHPL